MYTKTEAFHQHLFFSKSEAAIHNNSHYHRQRSFKKLIGRNDISFQFRKILTRYRRIGYNLNVMRQSACLVFNPVMVDNYAAFFNCTPMGRASDSVMASTTLGWPRHKAIRFSWLGPELLVCCLAHRCSTRVFPLLWVSVSYSAPRDLHRRAAY